MKEYFNPVQSIQGPGALEKLPSLAKSYLEPGKTVLLLVCHEDFLTYPGIRDLINIEGMSVESLVFSVSNPELEDLWEQLEKIRGKDLGLVVAVGGGSVMDLGKSLCCLCKEPLDSLEDLHKMIEEKTYGRAACPWIGIPTTAGTGSEVTRWATIWDSKDEKKYSIDCPDNYALAALVDPRLTGSMPLSLALSSALDALAHASESYWARATNTVSRALALEAIRIITGHLDQLLEDEKNPEVHDALSKGSMLAGLAFSNTKTTACHSISYPLTMDYHIPHGVAVSLLLGPVLELNLPAIEESENLLKALGLEKAQDLGPKIKNLLTRAGLGASLHQWGVEEKDLKTLASRGLTKGRADNNPVDLTEDRIEDLLKTIF